jgi:cytochrome b pre-mRNA-processing protein 3
LTPAEWAKDYVVKFLKTLFGFGSDPRAALIPLYNSVVIEARQPAWYAEMGVPDTLDGRFDMIAAVLALVLMRIEEAGVEGRRASALLTEVFVDDMDGQLRQIGIGDMIVGKHIGNMMAAMGGRLSVYRDAIGDRAALEQALVRNLWRGETSPDARPALVAERLQSIAVRLGGASLDGLLADGLPADGLPG